MSKKLVISIIIVIILFIWVLIKYHQFQKRLNEETKLIIEESISNPVFSATEKKLQQLPEPVANWLRLSHSLEKAPAVSVSISQQGLLRTKSEGKWMEYYAEQYSNVGNPGFIWKSEIQAMPGVTIYGRDIYTGEQADMHISILGLFTVGNVSGSKLLQGSLVRYLAEMVWYPQVALAPHITWEALDQTSARATLTTAGMTVSGTFYFKESGEPERFVAQRYKEERGEFSLEEWSVHMDKYEKMDGVLMPTHGEVTWNLKTGPFQWLQFEVKNVKFNH
ncbi:hypothetical protein PZE06_16805 [Robertmurraya sp. DFI.2.37]|uniref:DUF6544 family protein n=1 Tax=Robertmurraya sp. DFI.2.37 TaxID=3031819 RepID=UPI001248BAD2|nr:DUF6544 family protein [Robertmurraya sp. DFI.2.37]MDF1509802.1 hypothetical protein [Robertmurraya sp. DFI.2.37]